MEIREEDSKRLHFHFTTDNTDSFICNWDLAMYKKYSYKESESSSYRMDGFLPFAPVNLNNKVILSHDLIEKISHVR